MSLMSVTPATGDESYGGSSSLGTSQSSLPPPENMVDGDPVSESMHAEEEKMTRQHELKERREREKAQLAWKNTNSETLDGKFTEMQVLIKKSTVYASILESRMQQQERDRQAKAKAEKEKIAKQEAKAEKEAVTFQRKATRAARAKAEDGVPEQQACSASTREIPTTTKQKGGSENGDFTEYVNREGLEAKTGGKSVAEALKDAAEEHNVNPTALDARDLRSRDQPKTVSGGVMRSYQLEGLDWLASLYENGLNGILADEMGLGKTVQTISFLAFLREQKTYGPFLVAAPLSTLSNWIDEFAKWTPDIPTVLYHGSPAEREKIRRTKLKDENSKDFPVICTSYEICMNDRKFLSKIGWKFIIIDEGHRLKNLNCRLVKELKQYKTANRLLITGTPLQNNLAELWSLLNFLMPEIFAALDDFEAFFDFSAVLEKDGHEGVIQPERKHNLVATLHSVLKPFLLRRVKTDVESSLPKKREYILYAPLTAAQKELYRAIKEGNSRAYLEEKAVERLAVAAAAKSTPSSSRSASLKRKAEDGSITPNKSAKSSRASTPAGSIRPGRKVTKVKSYIELDDHEYFKQLEVSSEGEELDEEELEELERTKTIALAKKEISHKKLQNPIMQLRLVCNSPHNFYWPFDDPTTPDSTLITSSGKMLLLERLVPHLLASHHKVLIFSQFKTQLDILEDWATVLHGWQVCRIDGAVKQDVRRQHIKAFNSRPDHQIFLLSTRAGGQGINLTAADTVILFDSDWNPQQDLQAQDRAHRIGQTRPVIVYRLATKGTIEQTLLEKADVKRRLEKLVIQKGKFRSLTAKSKDDAGELKRILEEDDFEGYEGAREGDGEGTDILSDADLEVLCDRSEAAYVRAAKGEKNEGEGEKFRTVETKKGGDGLGLDMLGDMKVE